MRIYQLVAPVGDHEVELVLQDSLLLILEVLSLDQPHQSDQHVHHVHNDEERAKGEENPKDPDVSWVVACHIEAEVADLAEAHLVQEPDGTSE